MSHCPTPHISALPGDFAKTVLMPGDPRRAEFIAENFLDDVRLVNEVRGMLGYTGTYRGVSVSVMASGMGIPSISIYSHELFNFYGVENIIRIGSAGALQTNIHVRDIVIGMGSSTDSAYPSSFGLNGIFAPLCSFDLLRVACDVADEMDLSYHVGNLLTSDSFYNPVESASASWASMGVLAVEMESAGLYVNAARAGKRALAVCTVSDHLVTGEVTTAEERQNTFTEMITLALECARRFD